MSEIRSRFRHAGPVLVVVAPGQGSQTPGFLTPWLEVPGFEDRLRWLSTVAGIDLVAHGTTSDADTIRDTAVAQPLLVGAGLVSLLSLFPHPSDAYSKVAAGSGHSVGEITAAVGAGVITAEQAMVFVRERGKAMAAGVGRHPHRHDRRPRRRPRRGRREGGGPRPHRRQPERRRPDRRRRHARAARGLRGRPAGEGAAAAAAGRRRVPHPAHGARGRHPRPARAVDLHAQRAPADHQQRRRHGRAQRPRGAHPPRHPGELAGPLGPLHGDDGRDGRHRAARAAAGRHPHRVWPSARCPASRPSPSTPPTTSPPRGTSSSATPP